MLLDELKARYRRSGLGDGVLKQMLEARLQEVLAPIRERRYQVAQDAGQVMDILREGSKVARQITASTLVEVRRALGLDYFGG